MTMTKKYVVICEDVDPDDESHWYLTTRRAMSEADAAQYLKAIHPGRNPRMVPLETFIEMLPRGIEVHPGLANKPPPEPSRKLPTYVCRLCKVPHKGGMQCDGEP